MQTFIIIATVISAIAGTIFLYQVSRPLRAWLMDRLVHINGYVLQVITYCDNKLAPYKPAIRLGEKVGIWAFNGLCWIIVALLFLMWNMEGSISFAHFAVESGFFLILPGLIKKLLQHESNKKFA